MGQVKGTPTYTTQQQAYINKYGASNPTGRAAGQKPAMIAGNTNLTTVIDATFATDADTDTTNARITSVSSSINTTLGAVSSSINTTLGAVSSSINTTIGALSGSVAATYATSASLVNTLTSFIVYGGGGGGHVNDAAAASAGCPIGGLYHTSGTVKVRLT